ncbi:glycerophosphoryl diester phosphodiesterase membrane domain-containing protein [Stieleria sp. TO1_6]|uniref:glycerophosphodiester phosphodiesterase family protein n=1 Tax=Stieleria tagensis TaxID=2956795 RepID=UPI00209B9961|nr:glycerophosphodiester phosphodiesterase family protein [Stieleria tagensis]MCO8122291.1 glycerophosphoryl diester phosphodiesterase membrane domain-containing protein [Stieleria tagensis]
MINTITRYLRDGWGYLAVTDILFKLLAFVFLAPAVGLLFRLFVAVSGRDVLADTDIVRFLIHPLGWLTVFVVGAAVVCLFAIELALLMSVCMGVQQRQIPRPRSALAFVVSKSTPLLRVAGHVVMRCILTALPFVGLAAFLFWWLLTDHDINFYLTDKPPVFWRAVGAIGLVLGAMAVTLCIQLIGWVYATPIVLFEGLTANQTLTASRQRVGGHRQTVFTALVTWGGLNLAVRFVLSLLVIWVTKTLIWYASSTLSLLVIAMGLMILLVSGTNLILSILANVTLATTLTGLYVCDRGADRISVPQWPVLASGIAEHFTRGRVLSAVIVLPMVSALLGITLLRGVDLEDRVEITAHRGGAFKAPENTIAAINQAIEDETDWVEIDVQESLDGVVMVIHDSDLKKVGGNPTKIWNATADSLRQVDIGSFFDPSFQEQRLPTLDEVLKICRGRARVNIELKYYGHTQNLEQKVVDIVEANQMQDQIVVMSLEAQGVAKIRKLRPQWTVGLLTAVVAGDLTRTPVDFLAVKDTLATPAFVELAHSRGKTVSAWTLNDPYTMSLMISRGVDNLITDRPSLARQVLRQRRAMSPLERLMLEIAYYLGINPQLEWNE